MLNNEKSNGENSMSTKDLVNAIIVGDAVEIENAFQATMAEKISARLDDYRQQVAQTMFATEEAELEEAFDPHKKAHPNGGVVGTAVDYFNKNAEGKPRLTVFLKPNRDPNKIQRGRMKTYDISHHYDEKEADQAKKDYAKKFGYHAMTKLGEEVELDEQQLDELSKGTLGSYIKKASGGVKGAMSHAYVAGSGTGASEEGKKKSFDTAQKRLKGIRTAVDKLTKEDVEQLVVTTVESALYAMQDGRNVLDEQIDEAVSSSSKDNYEWTHGNKPKGHGNWFFSTVHPRQHDMEKHKDQTVNVTGTFGDAAKKAQAHFKEKGHKGEIHVLT